MRAVRFILNGCYIFNHFGNKSHISYNHWTFMNTEAQKLLYIDNTESRKIIITVGLNFYVDLNHLTRNIEPNQAKTDLNQGKPALVSPNQVDPT